MNWYKKATGPMVYLPVMGVGDISGGHKAFPGVWLRAGNIPNGPSTGYNGSVIEKGVSVYTAWKDPKTGKYVLLSGGHSLLAGQNEVADRPWFEVTGVDTGESGSDDEDLLQPGTIRIVRQVNPDEIVMEQDPWLTLTGMELLPEQTPDWESDKIWPEEQK